VLFIFISFFVNRGLFVLSVHRINLSPLIHTLPLGGTTCGNLRREAGRERREGMKKEKKCSPIPV
jgi:hypothetical protein